MIPRSIFLHALLILLIVGCEKRERPEKEPATPMPTTRPAASGPSVATPAEVELLHAVPAVVAVSSTVANQNDKPEHLVDGRLETAWNSRTGDLVGGWIAFRLPRDVTVKKIKLTAGYVHHSEGR